MRYKQIVVGTDGSAGADIAVDAALELARVAGATVHVVNAHKLTSAFHLTAAAEVGVVPNVVEANDAVEEHSRRICDRVVARARELGSVPNKVSHHCPSSLLIVDTSHAV